MASDAGGDAGLHDGCTTAAVWGREFIDDVCQRCFLEAAAVVVNQYMIGDHVSFDSRDTVESRQDLDDRLLRRTTPVAGQRKRGTFKRKCRVAPQKGRDGSQACNKAWPRSISPL